MNSKNFSSEFNELFSFLCETEEEHKLLKKLSEIVIKINKSSNGKLEISMQSQNTDEPEIIECEPGVAVKAASWLPESYAKIAAHLNNISWESIAGGYIGFSGLNDAGEPAFDWNWEPDAYLTEIEDPEKQKLYMTSSAAFGCGQNFLLFDPVKKNQRGETALAFFDDGVKWEIVKNADSLSYGGVLLRMMADYFLDIKFKGVDF